MPSTTTTSVTIGSIVDLLGGGSQTPQLDKSQLGFDVLLQPPAPPPLPRPPAEDSQPQSARLSQRDDRQNSSRSSSPPPSSSAAPAVGNSSDDDTQRQSDSSPDANATAKTPPPADDSAPQDEPPHAAEQVVAESLAGLVAAIPAPTVPPSATQAGLPVETAESELSESETLSGKQGATGKKSSAAPVVGAKPQLAADQESAAQPSGSPGQTLASSADEHEHGASGKQTADTAKAAIGETTGDKTAAADSLATALQTNSLATTDASSSGSSPHDQQHAGSHNADQQPPGVEVAAPISADPIPTVPTIVPVAAVSPPQLPVADPSPAANASNSPASLTAAAPAQRSRLPAEVLAPAGASGGHRATVEIDSARLLGRVARAFTAAQERDGEVRLRLSPPELGALRLDVRVQDGALVAHLHTETDAARTAILDNLPALRDRLADQGIRIERFDVDLMQRQPGGMPDQSGGRQPDPTPAPPRIAPPPRPRSDTGISSNPRPLAAGVADGLNVIV